MKAKKNVWILGGTGFIGKALLKKVSEDPGYNVHLLVHKRMMYKELEPYNTLTGSLQSFDFNWFRTYPPDIIFHMARMGGSNPVTRLLASVRGEKANRKLIQHIAELKQPPVMVYASGSLMYGHQSGTGLTDENSELVPASFARYYYRAEWPFIQAQKIGFHDIRFARPGWIVGPGSWFRMFYWQPYLATGKIPVYGDGNQLMSIVDLDDCARQLIDLAENGNRNQNLNVYSGKPISQLAFAIVMARLVNTSILRIPLNILQRQYGRTVAEAFSSSIPLKTLYPQTINCDNQKFRDAEAILGHTISLLQNHKDVLPKTPRWRVVEQLVDAP